MSEINFVREIRNNAVRFPEQIALRHGKQTRTYAELISDADLLAKSFRILAKQGRPLLLSFPNSIQLIEAVLAGFFAGAMVVPLVPEVDISSLAKQFENALLVGKGSFPGNLKRESLAANGFEVCIVDEDSTLSSCVAKMIGVLDGEEPPLIDGDDAALLLCTSGSTGIPKTAEHSYQTLDLLCCDLVSRLAYKSTDSSLVALPILRPFCLTSQILPALFSGSTLVIQNGFNASDVAEAIAGEGITRLYLYGHMYRELTILPDSP
ncbi:MAG: acyl--CoA ligase, partial [Candidatus Obscuribacterales bacterium]|nr:acyl--CoA ligase [Candidatus Obscuribacterales bacterium]